MTTSELLAFSFVVLLAVFTIGTGVLSLMKGQVYMVPGKVKRKERFGAWLAAVFVQILTGSALVVFATNLYKMLMARGH